MTNDPTIREPDEIRQDCAKKLQTVQSRIIRPLAASRWPHDPLESCTRIREQRLRSPELDGTTKQQRARLQELNAMENDK